MSFLNELKKQKMNLKGTETVVTNIEGVKYIEGTNRTLRTSGFGFVVDTKPDDVPILISECLYIGSQDCATDNILQKYNIQSVVSLGIDVNISVDKLFINILDLPEFHIKDVLKVILPFINNAVESNRNVLVHCNAGVSRTSMVAIAYLMHYQKMTFEDAYKMIKAKRPAIQPNSGFKIQLQKMQPGEII